MRGTITKLSVFTLFTILVTYWLASIIGNFNPFRDTYTVRAVFSDATGILNGDLVKIAGVDVGKVLGFEVVDGEAVVTLEVDDSVELPRDVRADIQFRNLLGQRVVNLYRPESPSNDILQDGDVIPVTQTEPALDLSVVFNNLRPLIQSTDPEDINTVAQAVLDVFEGREDQFAGILRNLGRVTNTLADRDQRLARLVVDLNRLTEVLNRRSGSIRTGLRQFVELMEALADMTPQIEQVIDQLDGASTKFGRLLARNHANLNQELSDLATLLQIVEENLGPLDRVAKNLKEVLLATARTQSYGRFWNLYIVNLCPETGALGVPDLPQRLDCRR